MVFLVVATFLSLMVEINVLTISILLLSFWFYFQFTSYNFLNTLLSYSYMADELSFFMTYMTVFVLFCSYVYAMYLSQPKAVTIVFMLMLLFCVGVFTTNNLFMLYFYYECSLLPILYIIIKWGSYPERSLSAVMLLIYTSIFTFPFIMVMFNLFNLLGSFCMVNIFTSSSLDMGLLSSLIIFFTFSVKLPIYGLHFWLPMAHVEAPTFGSMILAGVLLKLGGVGLLRCINYVNLMKLYDVLAAYLMVFTVYVTIVCVYQSDFKRLVAYSSVSHMMAVPLLYLSNTIISVKSILMIMLFHGLSSPVLFMLVGILYSMFSTRQLIFIRGLLLISPLLSFMMLLAFFFTMSAPPFPSFVAEVYFMISSYILSPYIIYIFLLFTFFSLVYNLNWLTSMVFSTSTNSIKSYTITYLSFMPLMLSFFLCFPMMALFYMI